MFYPNLPQTRGVLLSDWLKRTVGGGVGVAIAQRPTPQSLSDSVSPWTVLDTPADSQSHRLPIWAIPLFIIVPNDNAGAISDVEKRLCKALCHLLPAPFDSPTVPRDKPLPPRLLCPGKHGHPAPRRGLAATPGQSNHATADAAEYSVNPSP